MIPQRDQRRRQGTDAERALWRLLRSRQLAGAKFRRQHPFGPFVLDFFCMTGRLAVEADGNQQSTAQGLQRDEVRTRYLRRRGIRVLRLSDREILLNGEAVPTVIEKALGSSQSSDAPSP